MKDGETLEQYDERMSREAERSWNQKNGRPRATSQEIVVRDAIQQLPTAHPLEVHPDDFKRSLVLRSENRGVLVTWLREALVVGVDYGRIHFVKKTVCSLGNTCKNPSHFTKDILFKPGAQKICGMLGVTPTYPTLARYEEAALAGIQVHAIILRCQIVSLDGRVVSEGVGARQCHHDNGDLNKALKMASKSALLEATLGMGGLSEIFSHPDVPPGQPGVDEPDPARVPAGRYKDHYWTDVPEAYLQAAIASTRTPADVRRGAVAELARRPAAPADFDDDIP